MEQKPSGDGSGGSQEQPEIILSPSAGNTPPAPNKVCPNCGTVNPAPSVFCYKCGLKLPDITTQGMKICTGCHTPNSPTAQYCYKCGLLLPEKSGSGYASQIQYAGFWMRLAAYLIDGILLSILTGLISIPFLLQWFKQFSDLSYLNSIESSGIFPTSFWTFYLVYCLATFFIQTIYYTVTIGKWGRTVGKAALKIKVVKPDGSRVSYWRALGRSLAYYLNGFTFGLTFLIIAFTNKKRGLHDYIADTVVIKTN
jgi:uncharacterized RDD family membrane protein YckC/ribosomal protein L40E